MNNRELIYSLIRLSLEEVDDGFEVFEGVTVQQWQWALCGKNGNIIRLTQVLGMTLKQK